MLVFANKILLLVFISILVNAQDISISGTVNDSASDLPLQGVETQLLMKDVVDITDADGRFLLTWTDVTGGQDNFTSVTPYIEKNTVSFTLSSPETVTITTYTLKGRIVYSGKTLCQAGNNQIPVFGDTKGPYIHNVQIGKKLYQFKTMNFGNEYGVTEKQDFQNSNGGFLKNTSGKTSAISGTIVDTLQLSASGYYIKKVPVDASVSDTTLLLKKSVYSNLDYSLLNPMLEATNGQFEIYHVTNLNNSGVGSFPDAVEGGNENVLRIVVFDVSGACVMPLKNNNDKPSIVYQGVSTRKNLIVAGQTAPGGGFFFFGTVIVPKSNTWIRHITTITIDDHTALTVDGQFGEAAQGFKISSKVENQQTAIVENCDILHTFDTSIDMRPNAPNSTRSAAYINCLFGEPIPVKRLHKPLARAHHYTASIPRLCENVLFYGNIFLNVATRLPWVGKKVSTLWANNYFYNCGGPGPRQRFGMPVLLNFSRTSEGALTVVNYMGNHYQGGKQSNPRAYDGNNNALGFVGYTGNPFRVDFRLHLRDNLFTTNWKDTYTNGDMFDSKSTGKQAQEYSAYGKTEFTVDEGNNGPNINSSVTWMANPYLTIPFDLLPATDVKARALAFAGSRPANRQGSATRMIESIVNDDATVNQTGIRPNVSVPATVTEPVNVPNGIGTGNFTSGSGHEIVAGYTDPATITPLEAWLHGMHMDALGIPSGAVNYNPNIAALWNKATAR